MQISMKHVNELVKSITDGAARKQAFTFQSFISKKLRKVGDDLHIHE